MGRKPISPAAAVIIVLVVLIVIVLGGYLYLRGRGGPSEVPEEAREEAALDDQETIDPAAEAVRAREAEGRLPHSPDDGDTL